MKTSNFLSPIIKLVVGIILIFILKSIAFSLSLDAVVLLFILLVTSIAISLLLIIFINTYEKILLELFPSYPELSIILKNVVYLIIVVIMYKPLNNLALYYFRDFSWIVLTLCLIVGLFFFGKAAITLYQSLDKLTNLFVKSIKKGTTIVENQKNIVENKCPKCDITVSKGSKFCDNCGHSLLS